MANDELGNLGFMHYGTKYKFWVAIIWGLFLTTAHAEATQMIVCWAQNLDARPETHQNIVFTAHLDEGRLESPTRSGFVGFLEITSPLYFSTLGNISKRMHLSIELDRKDVHYDNFPIVLETSSAYGAFRMRIPSNMVRKHNTNFGALLEYSDPDRMGPVTEMGECISLIL